METATIAIIRRELKHKSNEELMEICLRLAKFKKENKELTSYLLFESDNEDLYVENVKNELEKQFLMINTDSYYYIKKSVRKILRNLKKFSRYSQNKETEIRLLIFFCTRLKDFELNKPENRVIKNIYTRERERIKKLIGGLHEDLQFDYNSMLEESNLND